MIHPSHLRPSEDLLPPCFALFHPIHDEVQWKMMKASDGETVMVDWFEGGDEQICESRVNCWITVMIGGEFLVTVMPEVMNTADGDGTISSQPLGEDPLI
ncbi:hypothetical protein L2E82_32595 [Cichorium intybus]|uniref:Uncharacterized protein n=1 Tax=Cichorium intybus TaxID=13427 RepID=A0ACB9BGV5_CICIN|nr:hypothetical protein L2E82_32595 [Cichorium intybus]